EARGVEEAGHGRVGGDVEARVEHVGVAGVRVGRGEVDAAVVERAEAGDVPAARHPLPVDAPDLPGDVALVGGAAQADPGVEQVVALLALGALAAVDARLHRFALDGQAADGV